MNNVQLQQTEHTFKHGAHCESMAANVHDDCLLCDGADVVGLFVRDVRNYSPELGQLLDYADAQFRSAAVPKSLMERKLPLGQTADGHNRYRVIKQYSTILGSIPKKPHMKRNYHSRSSVHLHESAAPFVRAMLAISRLSYKLVEQLAPTVYAQHIAAIAPVSKQWRFGDYCTSSISNYNIAAAYHTDNANVRGTVNVILTKRAHSTGGNLHVPDYGAVFDQTDRSMLVYPAWRNMHGVTPIVATRDGGYRNSLVFYTLKGFLDADNNGTTD